MNDEKRLELMQQMLSRLSGRPVVRAESAASEPAVEVERSGPLAGEGVARGPTEARLRALKELLNRLGG